MFEACFEALDLLWFVFDQIHNQILSAPAVQELDCLCNCNYRRACDQLPFKFILPWPSEAIKVCKLAVSGAQNNRPRREVLLEDYVFQPGNSFEMLQLFATGCIGMVSFLHCPYIRFLFAICQSRPFNRLHACLLTYISLLKVHFILDARRCMTESKTGILWSFLRTEL